MNDQEKIRYGALSRTHSDYDAALWRRLSLLYSGGWAIMKHAKDFLPQAPREHPLYYKWRCDSTSYVNYLARLVGYLTGSLFNETLVVSPARDPKNDQPTTRVLDSFYSDFASDSDQRGTDFSQLVRGLLASAMVHRRALVQVELPVRKSLPNGEPPRSRLEEEVLGNNRAYVIPLELESLINWEKDWRGRYEWCVLKRRRGERSSPLSPGTRYCYSFGIWTLDEEGYAVFASVRTKFVDKDEELASDDELEVELAPRRTSFRQIPILDLELPDALWVGNQAGPLCQEHYRRRSDLMGSLCRSLVEIPYVKLGPEIPEVHGAIPSEAGQDPHRGDHILERAREQGSVVLGDKDEIGFAGPSGEAFELASKETDKVREEIFASVNAMALQLENSAGATKRSGDSKREDRSSMGIILGFLATATRELAQQIMTLVSSARGDDIRWAATGLNTFNTEDRAQIFEDASTLGVINVPSPRFHALWMEKVAFAALPNATAKEKADISKEIRMNVHPEAFHDPLTKHRHRGLEEEPLG